ncbi:MAG: hypothetical protein AAF891_00070 [Pseudomonadota bacterium]
MSLKPLDWPGSAFNLRIERVPNYFFGYGPVCYIKRPDIKKTLPTAAGYHIASVHELSISAQTYFDNLQRWTAFHAQLCDEYCDYYVMQRPKPGNVFADHGDRRGPQELAKACKGYIGPKWWPNT